MVSTFQRQEADRDERETAMAPARPAKRPRAIGDTGNASKKPPHSGIQRWDTSRLSIALPDASSPIALSGFAPMPSPLADFSGCGERLLSLVNERAPNGVQELFNRIRQAHMEDHEDVDLRDTMLLNSFPVPPLSEDREHGFIVYLGPRKQHMAEQQPSHGPQACAALRYEWIQKDTLIKL